MKRLILIFGVICVLGAAPVFAQEEAEAEEKEPKWVGSLGLAWVATSGNTDTSSIGLDFGLESKPEPWGFSFAARRASGHRERVRRNSRKAWPLPTSN